MHCISFYICTILVFFAGMVCVFFFFLVFLFVFFFACLLYYWSCMVLIYNQISPYSTLQNHMATCEESPYLNGLFVFSGRMGAPSELSPWFGVHGWAYGHGGGYWTSSWRLQIVDDYRGTCPFSHRPLAGLSNSKCSGKSPGTSVLHV